MIDNSKCYYTDYLGYTTKWYIDSEGHQVIEHIYLNRIYIINLIDIDGISAGDGWLTIRTKSNKRIHINDGALYFGVPEDISELEEKRSFVYDQLPNIIEYRIEKFLINDNDVKEYKIRNNSSALENALYDIRKQLQSDENKEAVSNKEESLLKDIENALIEWFKYNGTQIDRITVEWIENEVLESEYELPYYFTLEFDDETFLKIAKYL